MVYIKTVNMFEQLASNMLDCMKKRKVVTAAEQPLKNPICNQE